MSRNLSPFIRRVYHGRPLAPSEIPEPPREVSQEIIELLATPTWSIQSLLPPRHAEESSGPASKAKPSKPSAQPPISIDPAFAKKPKKPTPSPPPGPEKITPAKLHHLLRLSALPLPKTQAEETELLSTLENQLHFVRAIQAVDTTDVEPLITIRDETEEARQENTIKLSDLRPFLDKEEPFGVNKGVRRRWKVDMQGENGRREREAWAVDLAQLGEGTETRLKGKYAFVKRTAKKEVARDEKSDTVIDSNDKDHGKNAVDKDEIASRAAEG